MSKIGGFASGLGEGLRTGLMVGKGIKDIKRDDAEEERRKTKFDWEKGDRAKSEKYQEEIADLTAKHPVMQFFNQKEAAPPAAAGIAPMADAANVPVNPVDAATSGVVPVVAQQQPGARAPMANAVNVPAAGLKPPAAVPKPSPGFNDFADFALRRAMIDARHGKTDGAGLINLYNGIKSLQQEGFANALNQMDAGNIEEGFAAYNSAGKVRKEFVSAKDGVYEFNGAKIPTKLITYKNADGSLSTLNTAQARIQLMSMDKVMTAAMKGDEQSETKRHNKATEQSDMVKAEAAKTAAGAKSKDEKGSLTQKDGLNVLRERFGGKLDAMGQWSMDDKNKDVAMRSYVIYQENLKTMEELPAAQKAADQAEREKATGKLPRTATGAESGATGNEGTKNFRTLWSN